VQWWHRSWTSSKPCIQAQTSASHTASHNNRYHTASIGGTNVASTRTCNTIMYPMPMDCLYMQPRLHPVCVRRRRKNQGKSALYTEEMRYLRRFVHLMQPEFKHASLPLPTELTATPYSGCQSLRGSSWCRSTRPISRLICGN
jgi:hypothetical protein